ncbi:MAG TPA: hypothetical protein VH877_10075 [Polyangia bacterium]|nr:hypothetical protein [Polyangia bacterium]
MSYLLDTQIVVGFQRAGRLQTLTDASAIVPLVLVEEVYDELTDPVSKKPDTLQRGRQAQTAIDAARFMVRSIAVGSPE